MSVRVMTAVWALDLPDSEKLVLLALADCANDEGHCWPSMRTLAKKCSKTDRTVQAAIKSLVDAGHLTRREVPGKGCNYTVHPRSDCGGDAPEASSPRNGFGGKPVRGTPEAASDKPSKNHKTTSTARAARGTRLREDWVPAPLSEELAAILPADRERELARFRDWAASAPGQKGIKLDWDAAWRNWLRRCVEEGRVRIGERPGAPGTVSADDSRRATERTIAMYRRLGRTTEADQLERELAA